MADSKTLLADAIRKRDELNTFIKLLQEMEGMGSSPVGSGDDTPPSKMTNSSQAIADPIAIVHPGMFWGKSQTQAAKILLERVGRPVKTKTILECFKKGGLEVKGKQPGPNLWKALNRASDSFVLVPKAGWDLIERYDPAVIAKMQKEGAKENGGEEEKADKPDKPK